MPEGDERETPQEETQSADQYVNEKLIVAEMALEEAIRASQTPKQRGALLGHYRGIVATLMRYYDDPGNTDNHEEETRNEETPEMVFSAPLEDSEDGDGVDLLIPEDVIDEFGLSEGEEISVEFVRRRDDDE